MKEHRLILIGDGPFAEIAFEYFQHDSKYDVVAFSVERPFLHRTELFGRPVVAFEELESHFAPDEHSFYVPIVYTQLNRLRTRLYRTAREKGYRPASYVSPHAFVWRNVVLGEHCFIFEHNVVQPFVQIGDNVVMWSGNHIGHHSRVGAHCFIASHVVISGFVEVGESCFLGVNSTVGNNLRIGRDCLIGAGATVTKGIEDNQLIRGKVGEAAKVTAREYFQLSE